MPYIQESARLSWLFQKLQFKAFFVSSYFLLWLLFVISLPLQPQLLELFDWEDRDKLMVGRRIDLSKSIPKDSPFLKTLAEQLTLMEFSIYAAIQRRYTYTVCTYYVASFPGHSQILSRSCGEKLIGGLLALLCYRAEMVNLVSA